MRSYFFAGPKYAGWLLLDLPESYLLWFARKGFPAGQLGVMMPLALEVKTNGLEYLLAPLRRVRARPCMERRVVLAGS